MESRRSASYISILLLIILVLAAGLRFYNLNWDGGIFAHPDERSTVAFYAPTIRWPAEAADLLDPRASTLNPFWNVEQQERRSYTYGHFPLYVLVLVAHLLRDLAPLTLALPFSLPPEWTQFLASATSGQGYAQIGRALAALSDLATVYLLFLLGRRLYGAWGGLLAAALSAFTVLQIQLAHFFAVDPISTTFTLLALYGAVLLYDRRSPGAAMITGLGIGLAVASKFSALPVAFAPVVAGYLIIRHHRSPGEEDDVSSRTIGLVSLALAISFLVFALTSPFVLLDFANFKRAVLDEQGNMVSGIADFPFTRQYRGTLAYWYFIEQQLRWGMGWPLGLLALAGTLWVAAKAILGKAKPGEWICLAWIVLYFGPTGLFLAKFMRYMVPVVPLFTLFGAGLVIALWRWRAGQSRQVPPSAQPMGGTWAAGEMADVEPLQRPAEAAPAGTASSVSPGSRPLRGVAAALAAVALVGSALWAFAFAKGVYGTEHSWITFSRWVYNNVPDGSCLAYEHWDDRLPTHLPEPDAYPEAHGYRQPQLKMYDEDTQQKYEELRSTLLSCDYIVLATNRLWRTIPRLPERYPMSTRYYEALFSGELGFEPVYSVETPPRLGPLVFDTQPADESFTVYDHPKPILFKKTRQLSPAEWDALLGDTWQGARWGDVGPPTLMMRLRGAEDQAEPPAPVDLDETKTLLLETPVDELPVVADYDWNSLANRSTPVAILVWWLATMGIGLISFPLTFLLLSRLPDRGYGLSKSLGLLLAGYFVWLNSSLGLLENRLGTVIIALVLLLALAVGLAWKQAPALAQFWRSRWGLVLATEILFTLIFLFFVYLRILNPDLWQPWLGGEKMLEIGFLNAIVKSAQMPPYDPFYAGGIINYYYYGLFLVGVLIKLTGIEPAIAFNLAVPVLAAFTAINAFSLAGNLAIGAWPLTQKLPLARLLPAGLLAVLFVIFIGNLEGSAQFMRNLAQASLNPIESTIPGLGTLVPAIFGLFEVLQGESLVTYNYWDPTRVIPATINEFPYFSFLFADLHPHMIGLPFTLLFLSLAYNWLLSGEAPADRPEAGLPETSPATFRFSLPALGRWLALPFVLGALASINTWDLPTYLGLMVAVYALGLYRQSRGRLTWLLAGVSLIKMVLFAGALLGLSYLFYAPFFLNYQALDVGLGLVHTQTPLDQHLKIWGFFLFVIVSWLWFSLLYPASHNSLLRATSLVLRRWNVWPHLSEIYRKVVKRESDAYQAGLWSIALLLFVTAGLFLLGYRVPAYLLPLVAITLLLLFRPEIPVATAYLGLLAFTGFLVLLGVEFFFLRDFLGGGDYYRMNTLFKFFIQVWVMFGLVAGVILPFLWERAWNWSLPVQMAWRAGVVLLLLGTLIYPIFGTRTRVDDRFPGQDNRPPLGTLDGLAYMTVGVFEWPAGRFVDLQYDREAIDWLRENVEGTPIIAEAKVGYYREGGMRVAAYTGLPSVLGGLHQNEQRYASQITTREIPVNEFWSNPSPERTLDLIDQLGISYIYIGQVERITHGDHVGDKFEQLRQQGALELVFENELTRIYRRPEHAR